MADFKDTREQASAKAIDRHISLSANAGSGKTTVLVGRLMEILKDHSVSLHDIVAITFTELAASQMREKLLDEINKKIDFEIQAENLREVNRYVKFRERIFDLKISTIHSFCRSIINDFPVESNVPPDFNLLLNAEQDTFRADAVMKAINYIYAERVIFPNDTYEILQARKQQLIDYFIAFKEHSTPEKLIYEVLCNRINFGRYEILYSADTSEALINARDEYLYTLFSNALDAFFEILEPLNPSCGIIKNQNEIDKINTLRFDVIKAKKAKTFENFKSDFSTIFDACLATFTTSESSLAPRAKFKLLLTDSEIKILTKHYKTLREISKIIADTKYDEQAFKYAKYLYEFGACAIFLYQSALKENNLLDFDDLLTIADKTLEIQDVRHALERRYKFIMVDEFQDTDDIQYSIIRKIVADLADSDAEYLNNLFIVGDPKQSIYRFRNADVSIFNDLQNKIKIRNCKRFGLSDSDHSSELTGKLSLTATFRLKPELCSFVNMICDKLFSSTLAAYEHNLKIEYKDLVYAAAVDTLSDAEKIELTSDAKINFLPVVKPYKDDDQDEFANDTDAETDALSTNICKYIVNLVKSGQAKYSDFGVLAIKNQSLDSLALEMSRHGIPFVNNSGSGFYEQPEVIALVSILRIVLNSDDDMAVLTCLKSDFFRFTNTDLFYLNKLVSDDVATSYYDKLEYMAEHFEKIPSKYSVLFRHAKFAYNILHNINDLRNNLCYSDLLNMVIDNSFFYSTIHDSPNFLQIKANVEKYVFSVRQYFSRSNHTLFDYLSFIDFIREHSNKEAQETVSSEDDTVTLLTIHKSKGLEFKHVILFGITSNREKTYSYLQNRIFGFLFNFNDVTQDEIPVVNSSFFNTGKLIERELNLSESNRLIYVALTRAKKYLTLAFELKRKKNDEFYSIKNSVLDRIISALNISVNDLENNEVIALRDAKLKCLYIPQNNESEQSRTIENYPLSINIIKDLSNIVEPPEPDLFDEPEEVHYDFIFDELKSHISHDYISASRVMKFLDDEETREGFVKKFILGIPEIDELLEDNDEPKLDFSSNNTLSGALLGTTIHYIFERLNTWYLLGKVLDPVLDCMIFKALKVNCHPRFNNINNFNRIKDLALAVGNSDFLAEHSKLLLLSKPEFEIFYELNHNYLQGILDLVIPNMQSEFEIWDWKSNYIADENDFNEKCNYYETQMKFYVYLLSKLHPEQNDFYATLIFLRQFEKTNNRDLQVKRFHWTLEEMKYFEKKIIYITVNTKNYPFFNIDDELDASY